MNHTLFTVATVLALAAGGCSRPSAQPSQPHTTAQAELPAMTVDDLAGMISRHEAVAVYDANAAERYAQGHIPSARHVGHDEVTAAILPPDHGTRLVFYCYNEH